MRLMRSGRFRHLPVLDNSRLVGIISDRDVSETDCRTVADVMHTSVIVVNPDTPIEVAAELMVENKIGALPVVTTGGDELVGIVSQTDLFNILARLLRGDSPSTRLELLLDDKPGQLAVVATLAEQHRLNITSLVTLPADAGSGKRRLLLRVGSMVTRPFVADLRRAGVEVDVPDEIYG
jgi:acetoin utilization protein AcuB